MSLSEYMHLYHSMWTSTIISLYHLEEYTIHPHTAQVIAEITDVSLQVQNCLCELSSCGGCRLTAGLFQDVQFTAVNQTSTDYIEVCLAFEMNSFKGKDESVVCFFFSIC